MRCLTRLFTHCRVLRFWHHFRVRFPEICGSLEFERIALNTDQVQQYNPPPNPAKLSDSRATGYITRFGYESWELDALNPNVIAGLIRRAVLSCRNDKAWDQAVKYEKGHIKELKAAAKHWQTHVVPAIKGLK